MQFSNPLPWEKPELCYYLKKLTSIHKPVVMLDHKENLQPNIDHIMHHEVELKAEIYIIQAHPNYPGLSCGEPWYNHWFNFQHGPTHAHLIWTYNFDLSEEDFMVVRLNSFLRKDFDALEHRGLGRVGRIAYINFSQVGSQMPPLLL